jgi:hypothetical protein
MARWHGEIWRDRLNALATTADLDILKAPPSRLSVLASTFIAGIIEVNRRRLCDADQGSD